MAESERNREKKRGTDIVPELPKEVGLQWVSGEGRGRGGGTIPGTGKGR